MQKTSGKKFIQAGVVALLFLAASAAGAAEQCRDKNGRFTKCPESSAPAKPARCRDVTSKKFVKCGSPNSEAVPASSGGK